MLKMNGLLYHLINEHDDDDDDVTLLSVTSSATTCMKLGTTTNVRISLSFVVFHDFA